VRKIDLKAMVAAFLLGLLALCSIAPDAHAGACATEVLQQQHIMHDMLANVARGGLRGDHHFSITFLTAPSGVRIPADQRERYPESMTVILQYEFEHLTVTDDRFEVDLFFKGVRSRVAVPFGAVTYFIDPSTRFQLVFDPKADDQQCGMPI
jgi:hypothetical protein